MTRLSRKNKNILRCLVSLRITHCGQMTVITITPFFKTSTIVNRMLRESCTEKKGIRLNSLFQCVINMRKPGKDTG